MGIGHRNDFLWDTDAASGFTYRNTGINLPKLFPSNCTAGQIQFSWYVRNEPSSAGAHVWGFCIRNPEGCPNSSSDIPTSSHGSFGQLYHMKGSQLHNCLTCPITFLAALLPFSLDKLSPGARSQGGIAKICYFAKSLFLGETGSMRNVIAGLEEFYFFFFLLKSVMTSFLSSPCICYFELHRFINTYQYANGPSDMNSFSVLMLRKYGVCVMHLSSWHKQTPAVIYLIF